VVLGVLGLVLIAAWAALTYLTRDPQATRDGFAPAFALASGLLGVLVAAASRGTRRAGSCWAWP
jgi:hypothetical protein